MAITSTQIQNGRVQLYDGLNKIREWGQNYVASTADGTYAYVVDKYGEVWKYDERGTGSRLGKSPGAVSIQGANGNITILLEDGSSDVYVNGSKARNINKPSGVVSAAPASKKEVVKPAYVDNKVPEVTQHKKQSDKENDWKQDRDRRRREDREAEDRRRKRQEAELEELVEERRQQQVAYAQNTEKLSEELLNLAMSSVDDYLSAEKKTVMLMNSSRFKAYAHAVVWHEIQSNEFLMNTFVRSTFSADSAYEDKYQTLKTQSDDICETVPTSLLSWTKRQQQTDFIKELRKACIFLIRNKNRQTRQNVAKENARFEKYLHQLEVEKKELESRRTKAQKMEMKYDKINRNLSGLMYWAVVSFGGA